MSRRSSLADQAYEELRAAIATERLPPGSTVVEADLAESLGVSRTPVRETLRRLELEGYLERDPGGKLVVHALTREELAELFAVRELLEGYATRLAADRISDAELATMDDLLRADLHALRQRDVDRLARINEELHGLVVEASRNRTLSQIVESIRGRFHGLSAFAVGRTGDQKRFVQEHAEMVRLLRSGDGEAAEELVREHLRTARDILLEGLEEGRHRLSSLPSQTRAGA